MKTSVQWLYENCATKPDIDHPFKLYWKEDVIEAMIEFAKYHVEQALKEASQKAELDNQKGNIKKDSILKAYPLNLIN